KQALAGHYNNHLTLWDLDKAKEVHTMTANVGPASQPFYSPGLSAVTFTPDGKRALSGQGNGILALWDLEAGKEVPGWGGHKGAVTGVALSADGKRAISASYDQTIKVWEPATGKEIRALAGHKEPVTCVALSPDGKTAVSGSMDRTVKLWD